jgi:nucleotide-binding universal stress UspA family protein
LLARLTTHLAELLDGEEEITVLHVMSQMSAGPGVRGAQLRARAEELIEARTPEGELLVRDLQALERPGVHPHAEVRHGLVVDEILAEAQSGDYDLVVIGAHRGEGWQRLLLDDLAQRIVAQLDRPVLVVR